MKRAFLLWTPLALFVLLFALFATGLLKPASHDIPSQMIGKPVPAFDLPPLVPDHLGLKSGDLATGKPHLLNIFASWCIPCIAEAPNLMVLKQQGVPIEAIAIRDRPQDVVAFLQRNGDPYARIGSDTASRVQLAIGSSGVPETFVVDGKGVIRHQHIGDIRAEDVPELLQQLEEAR